MGPDWFRKVGRHLPLVRDTGRWLRRVQGELAFRAEYRNFQRLSGKWPLRFRLDWHERMPCLDDKTATTAFDHHYVLHTAWAGRALAAYRPKVHYDIASSLYFAGILSAFVPVRFFDYRPACLNLSGLSSERADLLQLPFEDKSIGSLSCMHVIEHVGLGRYGDMLDPQGDLKAMAELRRVLAPAGTLLLVVPVGQPRIVFNAHRIYAYGQVRDYFRDLQLVNFALIPDDPTAGLLMGASETQADAQSYGCGCFWFQA